jgi:transposase
LEKALLDKPWQQARPGVEVKLLDQAEEIYVLAQSADRVHKERSMRRRQLKWLWARLRKLSSMKKLKREELLMKLGAAKQHSPSAYRLVEIEVEKDRAAFTYRLDKEKLRRQRRREGRYLLRTNLTETDPAKLWNLYLQLVNVEEAFKNLKGDLAIRPIFHQSEKRIEAHILISFLAYCLHITLTERLRALAPGLTARSALEKFASMQMIDVHVPTTDGREIVMTRTTQPEPELQLLLDKLRLQLPAQPPPRITSSQLPSAAAL